MIRQLGIICLISGTIAAGTCSVNLTNMNPDEQQRKELWQQVQEAQQKSLPKTAIEKLTQIYDGAVADEDYPEAVKALAKRYFLEGSINQPMVPYVIRNLGPKIDELPEEIRPAMNTILANWFFAYYQQNRWRFIQRTQTAQPPSEDFETWDLPRLLNEIDALFTEALSASEELKKISIETYDELLVKGNVTDAHRPTLFDFIAFQALDFYALDEQVVRKQGAFDLSADSPIFSSLDQFVGWEPTPDDDESFLLHAVKIFQEVLRFHQEEDDPTALLDADLHRLTFGYSVAVGSEKTARYKAALQRFADQHTRHPLSALALASLAGVLQGDEQYVEAREIASQGLARFPDSVGGRRCYNIIQQIEANSLSVSTERVWNQAGPTIDVTYRNIDQVHFRLVPFDYLSWQWGNQNRPDYMPHDQRLAVLRREPVLQWSANLPETKDYRQRVEQIPVDPDVRSGCYILIASHRADFSQRDNQVSFTEVWVSQLALVIRNDYRTTQIEGQVLDALSGAPVAGATVNIKAWIRDGRNSRQENLGDFATDASGMFRAQGRQTRHHMIYIRHQDQVFGIVDQNYKYDNPERYHATQQTVFFTDRSIYRPGQTINFKGICLRSDTQRNNYHVLPNHSVAVFLRDVNGEEVEKRTFRTNEFGSFSGSFTAPRDRATGRMELLVSSGPSGSTAFNVEEYKRPKFFVELDPPDKAYRLNEQVTVKGKATAYTGAPIDSGKVSWRVVREVRYPIWWMWRCWYCQPPTGEAQEIANGTMQSEIDGSFTVEFEAKPDLSVPRESEPIFTYTVHADVTDSAGETRSSSQAVRIGYTSLQAELNASSWLTAQEPVTINLSTSTLDGEGQETQGTLKIYQLKEPDKVHRAQIPGREYFYRWLPASEIADSPDLSKINAWPTGERIAETELTTGADGQGKHQLSLAAGAYKAVYETTDSAGQKVSAELPMLVVDPQAADFTTRIPHHFEAKSWSVEPGEEFVALWGSGYTTGRAFVELEHRGKVFQSYWTEPGKSQALIRQSIAEKHRGGFIIRVTFLHENRAYMESRQVNVPWSNKDLTIKWEHFVSKLQPGGRETWSLAISGPDAKRAAAEMVAALYDASLDAFVSHSWMSKFNVFYNDYARINLQFHNDLRYLHNVVNSWRVDYKDGTIVYRYFPNDVAPQAYWGNWSYGYNRGGLGGVRGARSLSMGRGGGGGGMEMADGAIMMDMAVAEAHAAPMEKAAAPGAVPERTDALGETGVDLSQVTARKNLQETAFFFPHLTVDNDGVVRIEFEIPEALTKWKFLGFAHDVDLRTSLLTDEVVTSKDLMVQPNPPRFLREGDALEFSVKVSNQSATRQSGSVRLTLTDARDEKNMDAELGLEQLDQSFDIPAGQSQSLFWKLNVPDFVGVLAYKTVGATDRLSDGEEGFLPVLSKRILVTESLPLPIRGNQTKQFVFERLDKAGESDTLQSQALTVQMTSNPAWYAVMALPYLMEYPHQCSEQVFNRLYANALAQHIANSDPKIRRIFEQWRGTDALDSPLEKNEDLRNVLIAESPWLWDAKKESQARRDVAILFDENRLANELRSAMNKLTQMQYSDGSWPWFPGGRANDYITLYITTGFGRLRHLGVDIDVTAAVNSLDRLDNWVHEIYQEILRRQNQNLNHLTPTICLYLYGRSFFLQDKGIDPKYQSAIDYFLGQAKRYWPELGNRQSQGHLAIALKRFGDLSTPKEIMASLTERSLTDEEMGMFWREGQASWWWYRAPIETQALLIEAYDEVMDDQEKVEECKVWLLKQKQTQNWKTTKATADAVYALLLRGTNLLASDQLVTVSLGSMEIQPENVEAGTGFYQERFVRNEIKPEMGSITVVKSDDGVAWGSVHWQYLEDISKIEPYEGTPLTLKKALFIKKNTEKGPVIQPVTGPVEVGDELVTRVELRVDREMEYVHLKDYRGSGTEPVNVLSQYKFQDGLAYYESTKDTASHFFIDYLPRGTYVFEYSVRVQHRGTYQTGIASLQCMYAPEFNSHSGSVEIEVQ